MLDYEKLNKKAQVKIKLCINIKSISNNKDFTKAVTDFKSYVSIIYYNFIIIMDLLKKKIIS